MIATIGRVIAAVVGIASGLLWLLCMYIVASSGFAKSAAGDPHGFGLMIGTVVGVVAGLVSASILPLAFPAARCGRVRRICMLTYVGTTVALYAALNVF